MTTTFKCIKCGTEARLYGDGWDTPYICDDCDQDLAQRKILAKLIEEDNEEDIAKLRADHIFEQELSALRGIK